MHLLKNVKFLLLVSGLVFVATISAFYKTAAHSIAPHNLLDKDISIKPFKLVVIDPGHGGRKPGAEGRLSKEKDIVLDISKKLKAAIQKEMPGIKVILTRETDIDVEFHERTRIANKNQADLFISIHCNSADQEKKVRGKNGKYTTRIIRHPTVKGTETFVCGYADLGSQDVAIRENADMLLEENYQENYGGFDPNDPSTYIVFQLMKRQYRDQSIKLASYMQSEFVKSNRGNRGVKEQPLAVLKTAGMPAVLTEIGFISNPEEEKFMMSEVGQKQIVENLTNAIKRFKSSMER